MSSVPSSKQSSANPPADNTRTFASADEALNFALARHQAGSVAEAADIYRQLLAQAPDNADILRLYGLALTQVGDAEHGVEHLQNAVRLTPRHALAHLHHGLALLALEHFEQAADAFRRASRLDHGDSAARLNLVNALLQLGKFNEALTLSEKVVHMAPQLAEGWNNRGLAQLGLGHYSEARDSFSQALDLQGVFPDAWVSLARVEKALGRFDAAVEACQKALTQQSDCVPAALNLANLLSERGDDEAAEDLYRQLLAIDPDQPEVRLGLANVLLERERADDAWRIVVDMQPPADLHGQWRQQRIRALNQLEHGDAARAELAAVGSREADELGLLNIRLGYALDDGDEDAATELAERIADRLQSDRSMPFLHRVDARFGLGDFWHGREQYERAFAEWRQGHELLAQVETFSATNYQKFTAALKSEFDIQRLADGPTAANQDPRPVFIVGMPRSGTTLVEQILDCHPQIYGAGELPDMARLFRQWGGVQDGDQKADHNGVEDSAAAVHAVAAKDTDALNEAAAAHLERLHALAPDATRVVDKMPHNFHYLGLIARLFPGARIIDCRRDPRDVAFSIYRRRFSSQHAYAHRLTDLALALREHRALMTHWQQVLGGQLHTVYYENLIEQFDHEVARLLDFLGVPFDRACLEFHANPRPVQTASRRQVRRPLYRSGIGQWRAYAQWLGKWVEPLAADESLKPKG